MAKLLKKVILKQPILKNNNIYKCKCGKYRGIVYARIKQHCGVCRSLPSETHIPLPPSSAASGRCPAPTGGHSGFNASYRIPTCAVAPDRRHKVKPPQEATAHASQRLP